MKYVGCKKRYEPPAQPDESKPCRCGTGFYCHRHRIFAREVNAYEKKILNGNRPRRRKPKGE